MKKKKLQSLTLFYLDSYQSSDMALESKKTIYHWKIVLNSTQTHTHTKKIILPKKLGAEGAINERGDAFLLKAVDQSIYPRSYWLENNFKKWNKTQCYHIKGENIKR